jgi:hypothetical protein
VAAGIYFIMAFIPIRLAFDPSPGQKRKCHEKEKRNNELGSRVCPRVVTAGQGLNLSRIFNFTLYPDDSRFYSSKNIVSDYGLDDRAIGVRSPAGVKDFSSNLCVQTDSGAHPASCTMGTGGLFPGGKSAAGA